MSRFSHTRLGDIRRLSRLGTLFLGWSPKTAMLAPFSKVLQVPGTCLADHDSPRTTWQSSDRSWMSPEKEDNRTPGAVAHRSGPFPRTVSYSQKYDLLAQSSGAMTRGLGETCHRATRPWPSPAVKYCERRRSTTAQNGTPLRSATTAIERTIIQCRVTADRCLRCIGREIREYRHGRTCCCDCSSSTKREQRTLLSWTDGHSSVLSYSPTRASYSHADHGRTYLMRWTLAAIS